MTEQRVSELVRQLRSTAGLTQAALAKRLHRTSTYVSKIERGERSIDIPDVTRWAGACGHEVRIAFEPKLPGLEPVVAILTAPDGGDHIEAAVRTLLPKLTVGERELLEAPLRYLALVHPLDG